MAGARWAGAGGISGLLELIRQRGEAIDADLQREYGLSLNDVVAGRVTLRRLDVLIKGLPPDGTAFWRAAVDDPRGSGVPRKPPASYWVPERDLMASVIDLLHILVWQRTRDGQRGTNQPKPIERPGVSSGRRMGRTSLPQEQVRALLKARGPRREEIDG